MNLVESIQKWLTFRLSAEQEDRFRQANFGADVEQARICILLIVMLIAVLVVNDYFFLGSHGYSISYSDLDLCWLCLASCSSQTCQDLQTTSPMI